MALVTVINNTKPDNDRTKVQVLEEWAVTESMILTDRLDEGGRKIYEIGETVKKDVAADFKDFETHNEMAWHKKKKWWAEQQAIEANTANANVATVIVANTDSNTTATIVSANTDSNTVVQVSTANDDNTSEASNT